MDRQKEGAGICGLTTIIKVILTSLYRNGETERLSREETWNIFMQFRREPLKKPIQVSTELAREIRRAELSPEGDYLNLIEPQSL